MKFDLVHDIQKAYRKTLNCMAQPGTIENIEAESIRLDINVRFYNPTMVLMFMLLDGEVTYKIISNEEKEVTNFVNQITFSKPSETEKADFIFILRDAAPEMVEEALRAAKIGDLVDPHKSATIVFEAEAISKEKEFALKGPGIQEINYVKVQAKGDWLKERDKKNIEYPLGVDMIFADEASNIMCLPRTTLVSKQVV